MCGKNVWLWLYGSVCAKKTKNFPDFLFKKEQEMGGKGRQINALQFPSL